MPAKTKAVKAVWNPGTQREEDEVTGRPTDDPITDLQRAGIVSSPPAPVKPAGSSPALRIACPVCTMPAGNYCMKPDGAVQVIAHKKRRDLELASRPRTEQS